MSHVSLLNVSFEPLVMCVWNAHRGQKINKGLFWRYFKGGDIERIGRKEEKRIMERKD
jgi:hypothetical protein